MSTIITDNEAWLDVRVGDSCTVQGKLVQVFLGSKFDPEPAMLIQYPDWGSTAIGFDKWPDVPPMVGKYVNVCARRTENGLHAVAIWVDGGAPVPL